MINTEAQSQNKVEGIETARGAMRLTFQFLCQMMVGYYVGHVFHNFWHGLVHGISSVVSRASQLTMKLMFQEMCSTMTRKFLLFPRRVSSFDYVKFQYVKTHWAWLRSVNRVTNDIGDKFMAYEEIQ